MLDFLNVLLGVKRELETSNPDVHKDILLPDPVSQLLGQLQALAQLTGVVHFDLVILNSI